VNADVRHQENISSMSIFSDIGKRSSRPNVGDATCDLIIQFLKVSTQLKASAFTFTELFSFVYFEIDSILYGRKIPARAAIAESLTDAYAETLRSQFKPMDENEHHQILMRRIQDYGQMFRARKEKSDIVEKLHFYLIQASRLDKYLIGDDSPIVIVDAFANMESHVALTQFYIGMLAPFIEVIVAKNK